MTTRADWAEWSEDYRAAAYDPAVQRREWYRRVKRHSLLLRLLLLSELAITVATLWLVAHTLLRSADGPSLLWAASVLLLLVVVWIFALINRRGTWYPAAETIFAYLTLARLRCRRKLNAVRFTWVMLGLTAPVNLVLLTWRWRPPEAPSPELLLAWALTSVVYAVFIGWSVWYGKRTRRELTQVERALAELGEEEDPLV